MFKAAGSPKGWSWSVEGGKLHCDILFWGKPLESVTSGSARRRTSVDTYLGPDRPRGWIWLSRAGRAGMDQGLWSSWLHRLWFSWFYPELFLQRNGTYQTHKYQLGWQQADAVDTWAGLQGCFLLFWWWGWYTCAPSLPAYVISTAVLQPALLSVALQVSSVFYGHIWNILLLIMQSICFSSLHLFVWMFCWVFSMYLIFLECYMLIASNFLLLHLLATSA